MTADAPIDVGVFLVLTDDGIAPLTLGRALEERGFESCFLGEHSHVPVGARGRENAEERSLDPFVALTAMAATTSRLRLGTGVALVPERDPIFLAKEAATLDLVSGGRLELGVGAGWLEEEMRNHGTDPARRFALLRERVLAIKTIWTSEEAEFHGELVDFDPIRQWPKPVQHPHPPILVGGMGPGAHRRVLEFGDGWFPLPASPAELAAGIAALQRAASEAGRGPVPVTVLLPDPGPDGVARAAEAGATRALLMLPRAGEAETLRVLDRYGQLTPRGSG